MEPGIGVFSAAGILGTGRWKENIGLACTCPGNDGVLYTGGVAN